VKILIIGNGFDLAHGLPTQYTDFLEFIKEIRVINTWNESFQQYKEMHLNKNKKLKECVKDYIENAFLIRAKPSKVLEELIGFSKDNFWINYFISKKEYQNEGWIDFELEIAHVIKSLEAFYRSVMIEKIDINNINDETKTIIQLTMKHINNKKMLDKIDDFDYNIGRKIILDDLNQLIRCLEIYVEDCLGKYKVEYVSPDIQDIKFDKILSFNYTDTYRKVYQPNREAIDCNFIHGKANTLNDVETNNMVLGIDEYLDDELRDKETTFIEFKKYYQRIHKKTGCTYKDWITQIEKVPSEKHEIFIFGHSLDVTDKDVIRELIDNKNIKTTIFYYNKDVYGSQIASLVKVLGQDNLINKVYGSNKTITFKEQKSMIQLKETQLEIKLDVYNLYNLYKLTNHEANALISKIKENVKLKNIEYFKTQYNVISIYDALILLGETNLESELLTVAVEVEEVEGNGPNYRLPKFNFNSWKRIGFDGEHDCNIKTMKFINYLNQNNRAKFAMMQKYQKIVDIIDSKDVNALYKGLFNYYIDDIDILSKIMSMLFVKFDEANVITKRIWECIDVVIGKTNEIIFQEYITNEKNGTNDLILKSRLIHLQEISMKSNHDVQRNKAFEEENEPL